MVITTGALMVVVSGMLWATTMQYFSPFWYAPEGMLMVRVSLANVTAFEMTRCGQSLQLVLQAIMFSSYKIRGRGVLPLPRWFTRCYRGVCRLAAAAAVHAHVRVCHLISGNRTRIDPIKDGIGLLGHHSGQKRILTILRSGELQVLILSGQSGNLILREVVHHAAEIGVAVVHDGAGVVCDSLTCSAVLLCNGVLQVADELLVLAAARCKLRGKCGLTRLPCVALLHDGEADGVVAVGHAAFQTVHELCVLVAELTDGAIHARKAVCDVGVHAVHLHQLVIAQRADAALDASQRTGSVLLVEALRQRRASICATLTSCASADQIGDVAVHAVVTTVSTVAVCTPAEDDGEDNNSPKTLVAEESAVVIAAVLPSQIASCKIVHNKTPFSFALCYPATVCSGRSQIKAVFVKSAKLRSVSLRDAYFRIVKSAWRVVFFIFWVIPLFAGSTKNKAKH
nr:MAG TPA: hypothetical protein [Caudoviricetes sp.]